MVFFHHPPYSSGNVHGTIEDDNLAGTMKWPYEDWGVDAVFAGHDHIHERILKNGNNDGTDLPYFVSGSGGRSLYSCTRNEPGSQNCYDDDYGTVIVTATGTSVTYEFWSVKGGLIDTYTVGTPPPRGAYAWAVAVGDDWSYVLGTSEPAAGWNDNAPFDVSTWATGPSGFGFGDGDDATVLSANGYSTVYTRKVFDVADPAAVTGLRMTVDYDDAYVAYLNGTEVGRGNFTGAPVFGSVADGNHEASGGGTGAQPPDVVFFDNSLLEPGDNVIAAAVSHTVAPDASGRAW